jgi:hypothetical protein
MAANHPKGAIVEAMVPRNFYAAGAFRIGCTFLARRD